jgi:hypothetical protein
VPEGKAGKKRLHFDLRADGTSTSEELSRLLALGAGWRDVGQPPDASWMELGDPEGNEFCLLARPAKPSATPISSTTAITEKTNPRTFGSMMKPIMVAS